MNKSNTTITGSEMRDFVFAIGSFLGTILILILMG